MKPLFIKKNGTVSKVGGIIMNLIPSYTMAEYNALTHKPLFWVRTDEEYAQIPASDVSYGSGSVEDALDDISGQIGDIETNLSTHTVLSNSASNVTLSTNTYGIAPVTLTKGLWIIEGKVQGINALTSNGVRNEIFFSNSGGTRYGLAQITLPHNSPYPVGSMTSLIYVSESVSIGIGSYFDTSSQVFSVRMQATKVMDF